MKRKKWLFAILFCSSFLTNTISYAQETEDLNVLREIKTIKHKGFETADNLIDESINFNNEWKFKLGDIPGFEELNFDDTDWRTLNVPHDWSIEGKPEKNNPVGPKGGYYPTGKGCYRKAFTLDKKYIGKRIKIKFDGVYMNSKVYVNGHFIGYRPYGFSTFDYDISRYLKYNGKKNILAVSVDNSLQHSCRWYTGSGINRSVHLNITEQQHFDPSETFFRTETIDSQSAHLKVDCKVISNNYPESKRIMLQLWPTDVTYVTKSATVDLQLKNADNKVVAHKQTDFDLRDYSEKRLSFDLDVQHPNLWSHNTPYLYDMELKLIIDGKLVNTETRHVGIRTITFDKDKGMLVNGQKVIAKGVCLHKDAGSFGTAVPREIWIRRLNILKEMGCNAIRAHGPVDPIFIDECDRMGFYMMCESFDEWEKHWEYGYSENPSGKLNYTYHLFFNQWAETDLKDMIRRDRNHPSVFMYSVGNEVPEQRFPNGPKTLVKLQNWAHETDSTRPVTVGCDWSMWANQTGFMDSMDIAGYNYPDRYYPLLYREQHEQYPNRIILGTENDLTLSNWLAVRDNPFVVGMFLWVGIDYIGESLGWPRRSWEWGLIDLASFPKSDYYFWQAYWSDKPSVHTSVLLKGEEPFKRDYQLASHWNFEGKPVDTVFVSSNQPVVELIQNGKSLGKKKIDPNTYYAIYLVNYKKGKLESVAFNDKGRRVASHIMKTADKPSKLSILPDKGTRLHNEEMIFLTVEVQDQKGNCHPQATNEIKVDLRGGKLLGIDSGDPYSHELFKIDRRRAYNGKLLLTIRVTDKKHFQLKCTSEGLQEAILNEKSFH